MQRGTGIGKDMSIPFKVAIDSRSREFQYKISHRYLGTNKFLYKIGLVPSSMCTFCKKESESIEHLLLKCEYSDSFWRELINWLNTIEIKIEALSDVVKMFGLWNRQVDFYLLDHLLILANQHIYSCQNKRFLPSLKIFLAKVFSVYQIEAVIFDSKGKRTFHVAKWKKFMTNNCINSQKKKKVTIDVILLTY